MKRAPAGTLCLNRIDFLTTINILEPENLYSIMPSIQPLLNKISSIDEKFSKIIELSCENFNIFKILKMEASETRLHSSFLAELLNPNGSHRQDGVFLTLFLNKFLSKETLFDISSAKVEIEKYIGPISEDETSGGRIDILISDKNKNRIIIENKIYASDQINQLVRYHRYDPKAELIYLTLYEDCGPDPKACGGLEADADYKILNYQNDILEWLILCRKEAVIHPMLREALSQYINLIKYLTGKTVSDDMNNEITNIITANTDSFNAAWIIANGLDSATYQLIPRLQSICQEIATLNNLKLEFGVNLNDKYNGFYFYKEDWQTASISFQFQSYDRELVYGVAREKECLDLSDPLNVTVGTKLTFIKGKCSTWWPVWQYMESPFRDWHNHKEPWLAIIDGSIKNIIEEKVVNILSALGEAQL